MCVNSAKQVGATTFDTFLSAGVFASFPACVDTMCQRVPGNPKVLFIYLF